MKVKVSPDNMKVHQVSPSLDFDTHWWVGEAHMTNNQPANTREKASVTSLGRTPERGHHREPSENTCGAYFCPQDAISYCFAQQHIRLPPCCQ